MGNFKKKVERKLRTRQSQFDSMKETRGYKRPGSLNPHKQAPSVNNKRI